MKTACNVYEEDKRRMGMSIDDKFYYNDLIGFCDEVEVQAMTGEEFIEGLVDILNTSEATNWNLMDIGGTCFVLTHPCDADFSVTIEFNCIGEGLFDVTIKSRWARGTHQFSVYLSDDGDPDILAGMVTASDLLAESERM